MRVIDIRERSIDLSRYRDPSIPSGGLTTSIVALTTDAVRNGRPIIGYGFASMGRFAQGGLIRERFAPRLLAAGDVDPITAWTAMMKGEKPGGHGERCVAVGTLDMALWDAAAKIADLPLHRLLRQRLGNESPADDAAVPAYASGGYLYPSDDPGRLRDEMQALRDQGYDKVKIKIGAAPLAQDLKRVEIALKVFPGPHRVAVDAMNSYDSRQSLDAAKALAPLKLTWFEDICDPLDFDVQSRVAEIYDEPIAPAKRCSPPPKPCCWTVMAGSGATETSCCSTRSIATACPATFGSSRRWKRAVGRAARSGRMAAISSRSTLPVRSASAGSR